MSPVIDIMCNLLQVFIIRGVEVELSNKIQDLEGSHDSERKKCKHWHAKIADMVKQLTGSHAQNEEPEALSNEAVSAADPHALQFKSAPPPPPPPLLFDVA